MSSNEIPPTRLAPEAIRSVIADALAGMGLDGAPADQSDVHLERPANLDHGDFSTNTALALGKRNG